MSLTRTTAQAAVLAALSNILAQAIKAQRAEVPLVLDAAPIYRFVIFTILNTPVNILWQAYLESAYPSTRVEPVVAKTLKEGQLIVPKRVTDVKNTIAKFLLDQTIGAAYNNIAFLAGIAYLSGFSGPQIIERVKTGFVPLQLNAYKLWPFVSLLDFTVVPPKHRVIVGSIVGVAWGVILSLIA